MRILIILASLMCALACTSVKTTVDPDSSVDQPIDSCQVFWDDLEKYWVYGNEDPLLEGMVVKGVWAEFDAFQPATYRIQMAFYESRNCIIGMTPEELKLRMGEHYYEDVRGDETLYIYSAIVLPEGYERWDRRCSISISSKNDTLKKVTWRTAGLAGGNGSIIIE